MLVWYMPVIIADLDGEQTGTVRNARVNFTPSLAFAHDVTGNTPLPLGNFVHGRKSLTLAAEFTFQNAWALELRYVNYFGASRYNLLGDRDFVSTTLKYSF